MADTTTLAERLAALTVTETSGVVWFDLGSDPANTEAIALALAEKVRDSAPTAIVSWGGDDESVIAHVVARELGLPRGIVDLDLGLLTLSPALPAGSRTVLVGTRFDGNRPIASVSTLLSTLGHELVLAAALEQPGGQTAADAQVPFLTLG